MKNISETNIGQKNGERCFVVKNINYLIAKEKQIHIFMKNTIQFIVKIAIILVFFTILITVLL